MSEAGGSPLTEGTIHSLLERLAAVAPDEPAFLAGPSTTALTFGAWFRRSVRLSSALRGHGVGPDSRVAIRAGLVDWADYVVGLHAIYRLGATAVSLGPACASNRPAPDRESPPLVLRTASVEGEGPTVAGLLEAEHEPPAGGAGPTADCSDRVADVVYTSGATGQPKPVEITHRGALWNFTASESIRPGRVGMFSVAPPGSNAALELSRVPLGGALLAVPPSTDPRTWRRVLETVPIRNLSLVPAQARMLVQIAPDLVLPEVKIYVSNSDALSVELHQRLTRLVPNATVFNSFATSEGGGLGALWTEFDPAQPGRVGASELGFVPRIESPNGDELERGRVGRILLPDFESYGRRAIEQDVESAESGGLTTGWIATGDLGYVDADGSLVIVDRERHVAKVGGTRVSTRAIEHQLVQLPEVDDVAVVTLPHRLLGSKLHAVVVTELTSQELGAAVKAAVPVWASVMDLHPVDELPMLTSGKVDKLRLEGELGRRLDGQPTGRADDLLADVIDLFAAKLGVADVDDDTDFFAAGGDSLGALEVIETLSEMAGFEVDALDFWERPTPRLIAASARRQETGTP